MYDTLHAPATGTGPAQEFLGSRELTPTPNPRLESVMYLSAVFSAILKEKQPCGDMHVAGEPLYFCRLKSNYCRGTYCKNIIC